MRLVACALASLVVAACGPVPTAAASTLHVTNADNGRTLRVSVGTVVDVRLAAGASSAGPVWSGLFTSDAGVLAPDGGTGSAGHASSLTILSQTFLARDAGRASVYAPAEGTGGASPASFAVTIVVT